MRRRAFLWSLLAAPLIPLALRCAEEKRAANIASLKAIAERQEQIIAGWEVTSEGTMVLCGAATDWKPMKVTWSFPDKVDAPGQYRLEVRT